MFLIGPGHWAAQHHTGTVLHCTLVQSSLASPATPPPAAAAALLGAAAVPGIAGRLAVCRLRVLDHIDRRVVSADGGGVRGGVLALGGGGGAGRVTLGSDLIIERVETLRRSAVEVEPPVADEVVLVEESSVGAEEAVLGKTTSTVGGANVEDLAFSFGVGVVSTVHLAVTRKSGLRHLGIDRVILSGHSGHGFLEHGQVVVSSHW